MNNKFITHIVLFILWMVGVAVGIHLDDPYVVLLCLAMSIQERIITELYDIKANEE